MVQKAFFSWSGGKDSALALYYVLQNKQYQIVKLVTNVTAGQRKIAMHGVRQCLLEAQAKAIGLPLHQLIMPSHPTMPVYDNALSQTLAALRNQGITTGIYGDIFLEDLRTFRQNALANDGLVAEFPLWKKDSHQLINDFIDLGFKAVIVCVDGSVLPKSFVGQVIDRKFVESLPPSVNVCGENGEYHSFVFDGPLFAQPIAYRRGRISQHLLKVPLQAPPQNTNSNTVQAKPIIFYYQDLVPA